MNHNQDLLNDLKEKISPDQYQKVNELLHHHIVENPRRHLSKIPLLIPLLGTFGLVSTFYGFEKFLDQTQLINYPFHLIGFGVLILLITGAAATKL